MTTVQYPEEKPIYPPGYRGLHRLVPREDGKPRCVACYMCSTICPAQCIYIEAGEYADDDHAAESRVTRRYPTQFVIDELRCIVCGFCVDACPKDAIRMDTYTHTPSEYTRQGFVYDIPRLLRGPPVTHPSDPWYKRGSSDEPEHVHKRRTPASARASCRSSCPAATASRSTPATPSRSPSSSSEAVGASRMSADCSSASVRRAPRARAKRLNPPRTRRRRTRWLRADSAREEAARTVLEDRAMDDDAESTTASPRRRSAGASHTRESVMPVGRIRGGVLARGEVRVRDVRVDSGAQRSSVDRHQPPAAGRPLPAARDRRRRTDLAESVARDAVLVLAD